MSNKLYDTLKMISIILPYVGAFFLALGNIWGWEVVVPISATIEAFAGLLGSILKVLSDKYHEGKILVEKKEDDDAWSE